jgi:hypothetical protein
MNKRKIDRPRDGHDFFAPAVGKSFSPAAPASPLWETFSYFAGASGS